MRVWLNNYLSKNKKKILIIVGITAGVILSVQAADRFAAWQDRARAERELAMLEQQAIREESSGGENTTFLQRPDTSPVLSTNNIQRTQAQENVQAISEFITHANNGRVEDAYNMLSEETRQMHFSTVQEFQRNYVNRIFTQNRMYEIVLWASERNLHTYRVTFMEDILASGNIGNTNRITDYITVIRNSDGELSLNLNSYIGRRQITQTGRREGIEITVLYADIFMDYQTYTIEVSNTSNRLILLNNKTDVNTMFLQDNNENRYTARLHEIDDADLVIGTNITRRLTIRFNKVYGTQREIRSIWFTNIIMDLNQYMEDGRSTENVRLENIAINI